MPIYVSGKNQKDFTPAPEGLHQAVCVDVVDKGMVDTFYQGKPTGLKHKIQIRWQITEIEPESGKPFLILSTYTASLHPKAILCQQLEAWRGKKFTESEIERFDVEMLIGVNCQLSVVHNKAGDTTYANVNAIVPLGKGMDEIKSINYERVKDREGESGSNNTDLNKPDPEDEDLPF